MEFLVFLAKKWYNYVIKTLGGDYMHYKFQDEKPVDGYFRVKNEHDLWGMISATTGEEVIQCKYSEISFPFPGGTVWVRDAGTSIVDDGHWIPIPPLK